MNLPESIENILENEAIQESEIKVWEDFLEKDSNSIELFEQIQMDLLLKSEQHKLSTQQINNIISDLELQSHSEELVDSIMDDLPTSINKSKKTFPKWLYAIAASLLLAIIISIIQPSNTIGKVVLSSNGATIIRGDRILPANNFSDLRLGDIIQTDDDFSIAYEDNSLISLSPKSTVAIQGSKTQKQIFLKKGSITATIKPQNNEKPFLLQTKDISVNVIGTKFILNAKEKSSSIMVEKGKVSVNRIGKTYTLEAGQALFTKNKKTKWLGHISPKDFIAVQKYEHSEVDLSLYKSNHQGLLQKSELFGISFLTKNGRLDRFSYDKEKTMFAANTNTVCNITFKTDGLSRLNISFEHKNYKKIYAIKPLKSKLANKWQTISVPLSEFRTKNEEGIYVHSKIEDRLYSSVFIHTFSKGDKNSTYLEIGSIWFTKK